MGAGLGVALAGLIALAGTASWLDAPPSPWNTPSGSIPTAPRADGTMLARCADQERAPAAAEEAQVAAVGWRLQRFWTTQRGGDVVLVTATAGYDGMCRPWEFQVFAFAGGRYAGTLAPEPMRAREDGVLSGAPTVSADDRVVAQFTRYAPTDPLCCPSRGRTTVEYAFRMGAVVPGRIFNPATPTQLPRAGGAALAPTAAFGGLLLLAGLYASARFRHSKWRPWSSRT